MKRVRCAILFAYALAWAIPVAAQGPAQEQQNLAAITDTVESFIHEQLAADPRFIQLEVKANPLDNRLRLAACSEPLQLHAHNLRPDAERATVKVSCRQPTPWSLYVSARVDGMVTAAVASRSLARGHRVSEDDIALEQRQLSELPSGYLSSLEPIIGMETRRTVTLGETYRVATLKQPLAVKKGDAVVVEASSAAIAVVAPGVALADGRVGQQIRVKNSRSERTIKAVIVGPGRVQVRL